MTPGGKMLSPTLMVEDIGKSLEFYTQTLGFEEIGRMAGPDGNLVFGNVKWKDIYIMFGSTAWLPPEALPHRGVGVDFYIAGDKEDDIDRYYLMLKEKGVNITKDIEDQFWGDRTFSIKDPDGYQLTFAKPVREVSPEEMAEALRNMEIPV
jgi:PhnB protein